MDKPTLIEVAKASPSVAVTGLSLYGVTLQDGVLLATLVYTLFQLYFLLRDKWWAKTKGP